MKFPFNPKLFQSKDELNKDPARVGKAVYDILSKPQSPIEVGEIISEYAEDYLEEVKSTIKANVGKYDSPFYIVVLTKKEPWALNVLRSWFIARQTRPSARLMRCDYPNHGITLYRYDSKDTKLDVVYSLPTLQDSLTIIANQHLYDPQLVQWIKQFASGELDKEES